MKLIVVQFFIISLLFTSSFFALSSADSSCGEKCNVRCSKNDRKHEECIKDCNICCEKCNCVPSGTYGNKDECPCYRDIKNSKGGPKCP
ncbi:PREDICTED: gibberellin-regulated protein 8-like [Camelina sativa]|uniref:Gibberellin-regulated protein 8-like n=1 Tax=Camelina sativa TaxID=90675 RepID=A0ABM1R7B7_CAMSA|nr:PREDICTED: gibberellin-regulated protein 8-like [Camelina sativa]